MTITKLYQKAYAATQLLRREGRHADADNNYQALHKAVRDWRCQNLTDEELTDILSRIGKGEVITQPEEGTDPAAI